MLQKNLTKAEPLGSWIETSEKLKDLDGLLCVDTAIAHLAGLIKLPTVLVLNTPCDWRWGMTGCSSRWYPNINIIRRDGDPSAKTLDSVHLLSKHVTNNINNGSRAETNVCGNRHTTLQVQRLISRLDILLFERNSGWKAVKRISPVRGECI